MLYYSITLTVFALMMFAVVKLLKLSRREKILLDTINEKDEDVRKRLLATYDLMTRGCKKL